MNKKQNLTLEKAFQLALQNRQDNLKVAENLFKETLQKEPNHFQANFFLGVLSAITKKFDIAKHLLNKATEIDPYNSDAHTNLGNVLKELGEYKKAISLYEKAIQIQPNSVGAYNNLGNILKELGDYKKAIVCYEKIIQIQPNNNVSAYNNLAYILEELGEYKKAIALYEKAIQIDPTNISIINGLSDLFKIIQLDNLTKTNSASLKELLLFLYRKKNINHADIFRVAKLVVFVGENDNQVHQIVNSDSLLLKNKIIQNLPKEELFLLMLQKSLMADKFLEKLLTKLRYEILYTLINSNENILKGYFDFIVSLAQQCLLNEYVYVLSKKEINQVNQLKNKIVNNKRINELEMAILGCYIPLYTSKNITKKLLDYKSKNILFNDLITMQIKEPLKEIKLVNSIKSFDKIFDAVSKKVREQYEENPYPRWRYTYKYLPSNFLFQLNKDINPNKIKYSNKFVSPKVLIAGCGTGKHITMADRYLNANILGVDLSLVSLAYAKRKTDELSFKNIEFLHADILQLKNLNRKFDVIECVGTLHHMKDPLTGLKVLLDILEPHGFFEVRFI